MGVPTFKFKLLAFAIGAAIGGLAGALFAGRQAASSTRAASCCCCRSCSSPRSSSVARATAGASSLGGVVVAYLPERFREFAGLAGAGLRPGADACW